MSFCYSVSILSLLWIEIESGTIRRLLFTSYHLASIVSYFCFDLKIPISSIELVKFSMVIAT